MQEISLAEKTSLASVANEFQIRKEKIIRYLQSEEPDEDFLSDKEKKLLARWTYADELIRANVGKKRREDIAALLMEKFSISRSTAYQDIVNAEAVFFATSPFNKQYRIALRIEFLEKQIRDAAIAKDYKSVAQLEKSLASYIEMLPNKTGEKDSPTSITYNIIGDKIINQLAVDNLGEAKSIIANYANQQSDGEAS